MNTARAAPIRILPPEVAGRIAAGEVITRPLSVVRELFDNAVDAGATRIEVEIEDGGYGLVGVHDNGCGIPVADTVLLGTRHATSKLRGDSLDDIATLGFRGEALASMLAVADVEVRTRHRDEVVGSRLIAHAGAAFERIPCSRQPGASVVVRRLFARYPVRRSAAEPSREQAAIQRWVEHAALVRHDIAVTLRMDGRVTLRTSGSGFDRAAMEVFGETTARRLMPIGPFIVGETSICGAMGGPSLHRARRDRVVLAINGRLCVVAEVQRAIDRASAEFLPRRRFPYAVLFITAPPCAVDVNIHPAKEEVGLVRGQELADALERALRREFGRGMYAPPDSDRLALAAADLPGLRAAERGEPYGDDCGWGGIIVAAGTLPRLRLVGQIDETLIVCESELGTLLVDQHRAHERVMYDRLGTEIARVLPEPVVVRLDERHALRARDCLADLAEAGWVVTEDARGLWCVSATPVGLEPADLAGVLEQAAIDPQHSMLAAAACHAAIRKRRPLSPAAARELLEALTATSNPTTCPHGQPIVLRLDRRFLERQFGWR